MTNWPITCVLIGNGSLLQRCGAHLLAVGARVVQVVSEDEGIRAWATEIGVPCEPFEAVDPEALGSGAVDAVFSIGNLRVLSEAWRRVPRRFTVNFHDGPLPAYQGLHVTSWALMAGERAHGITWHVATAAIDGGDILAEASIDIAPDDTAVTLNAKCYDAGLSAFEQLIVAWREGTLAPRSQPPGPGQYFVRRRRPEAAGYVNLSRGIDTCAALVRALDFGPYENPLCTPWMLVDGAVVPATIERLDAVGAGTAAAPDRLAPERALAISARHTEWCLSERAWVTRLRDLAPLELPLASAQASAGRETRRVELGDLAGADAARLGAAALVWLTRAFDQPAADIGCRTLDLDLALATLEPWFETLPPLRVAVAPEVPFGAALDQVRESLVIHGARGSYLRDLTRRYPALSAHAATPYAQRVQVGVTLGAPRAAGTDGQVPLRIDVAADGRSLVVDGDLTVVSSETIARLAHRANLWLRAAFSAPSTPVGAVSSLDADERERLLTTWNATAAPLDRPASITVQFAAQAAATPEAPAVRTWTTTLSYGALKRRATQLARVLAARGVGPGDVVGLHVSRSADLLVAVLAVLETGAAYLPIDPEYPADRVAFMIDDSGTRLVVTESRLAERLPALPARLLLDTASAAIDAASDAPLDVAPGTTDLAYLIYTSGSTGRPKGVMLEHGNVTSFFAAMDRIVERPADGVWLAVTSLSFDISVLELLWTLCRGLAVVPHEDPRGGAASAGATAIDLSLFYFASDEQAGGADRYRLLLDGARFADAHGFEAVWTPERHFHAFGGLYPNPAITSAAIATITSRVAIRAGSLVLPLHHPVRAAEDWALVDNLSNGRVGIAFASGWHPNDFVLAPANFRTAKQVLFEGLATMRKLWRGEAVSFDGPTREPVEVRTLPRPVQPELPYWITTAGNPETFRQAGEIGANVLTHLLGQTVEEVAAKIRVYREARRAAGHAGPGHVTLMLHTFVGDSDAAVREIVRAPMKAYLGTSLNLVKQHAWSFPAFKGRPVAPEAGTGDLFQDLSAADLDALLDHAFERYFDSGGLFGSVDTCVAMVERLRGQGVDEIACLIDFGVPADQAFAALEPLAQVRTRVAGPRAAAAGYTVAEALAHFGATHLQCTPSMAALLVDDPAAAGPLAALRHWLVGGEALPAELAARMLATTAGRVTNMYGPTETTVWSLSHDVRAGETPVPIGRPIANTRVYVLDRAGAPVPIGAEGELYVGGPGVARGYHARPDLTAERFVPDRFGDDASARLYRTGDRVRYRDDGVVEFLGRMDQQVKVRGHRIELGEIEAALRRVPGVREAAVVAHEAAPGDMRLLAFVTAPQRAADFGAQCRAAVRAWLPEVMVPAMVTCLERLPLTPNGKIDRRQLPIAALSAPRQARPIEAPDDDLQRFIAEVWKSVLRTDEVGIDDNFFDLGGHSLLTVQVASRLSERLGRPIPIADLFRFPTVRRIASFLGSAGPGELALASGAQTGQARAAARRGALQRRGAHDR